MGEAHPARRCVLLSRRRPSQQRFRTPERLCGAAGIERVCFNEARQEGAVELSLHHARSIPEHMDPLGEGLLRVGTGRVVVLAQPRRTGRELHEVAARGGRLLPEDGHQGARGADLDRPAKRLLEGDVGGLLRLDDAALTDEVGDAGAAKDD